MNLSVPTSVFPAAGMLTVEYTGFPFFSAVNRRVIIPVEISGQNIPGNNR